LFACALFIEALNTLDIRFHTPNILWASLNSTNSTPEAHERDSEQAQILALQIPLLCGDGCQPWTDTSLLSTAPEAQLLTGSKALTCTVLLKTWLRMSKLWISQRTHNRFRRCTDKLSEPLRSFLLQHKKPKASKNFYHRNCWLYPKASTYPHTVEQQHSFSLPPELLKIQALELDHMDLNPNSASYQQCDLEQRSLELLMTQFPHLQNGAIMVLNSQSCCKDWVSIC